MEATAADVSLAVTDLRVGYGDLIAVWGVSLDLRPGRVHALVGRNGAGKTTLLSGICGLLPAREGTVVLNGEDVTGLAPWRRVQKGLGVVQEGKRVFRQLSVRENLALGSRGQRGPRRASDAAVEEMFDRFPALAEKRTHQAGSLSGGQQQMLAIATALAARPSVLLVDEPSSGLAPVIVDRVFELLAELKDEGLAILLVEQLVEDVLGGLAEDVTVLDRGKVVISDEAANLTTEAVAESIYASSAL